MSLEDELLAHRYLYYVLNTPIISGFEYDRLEKAEIVYNPNSVLNNPGSDLESSYSEEIKQLAKEMLNGR